MNKASSQRFIDVRERDQIQQKRVYFGAIFSYNDQREVIPNIAPGAALEYTIASTIKKLIISEKKILGLVQDHGEPKRNQMNQLMEQLENQYEVRNVRGLDSTQVPPDIDVLMIIAPKESYTENELFSIDQFIMKGGKLIALINRMSVDFQSQFATISNSGIERLMANYGININADLLRDLEGSIIQVQQQRGGFTQVNSVRYPFIPQITNYGNHPITQGLEVTVFPFVSSVNTNNIDTLLKATNLISTSNKAGRDVGYVNINPYRQWKESDFTMANINFGSAIEGKFTSAYLNNDSLKTAIEQSTDTKIVVIGDGDFIINSIEESKQQQPQLPDNINLFINSIDWLIDDTGLIGLRTKGITARPLANLGDEEKTTIKLTNLLLPLILVFSLGLFFFRRQQKKRKRWQEQRIV